MISSLSRINEAGQIDSDTTYAWSRTTNLGVHADYHLEEPLESWGLALSIAVVASVAAAYLLGQRMNLRST